MSMKKQKKKVAFVTLGCKVNTYEAEAIGAALEDAGFECLSGLQEADIYVLSTCAVTNEAERKSRGQIAKILKLNPDAEIYEITKDDIQSVEYKQTNHYVITRQFLENPERMLNYLLDDN